VSALRLLTQSAPAGLTGRELAQRIGFSPTQTARALGTLEAVGIVRRESAGRAFLWKFSPDHVLAAPILQLFDDERSLFRALREDLSAAIANLPTERSWLFGSIARGDERPTSDIDVLVEVDSPESKRLVEDSLSALTTKFLVRFGNPLSTLVLERRKGSKESALLGSVRDEAVSLDEAA
jgi:predicted nucleotidyltransferase